MKTSCDVIRDLIPAYVDEILSDESNNLVNEHTRECKNCNELLSEFQIESNFKNMDEKLIEKSSARLFIRVRKQMLIKSTINMILALVLISICYLAYVFYNSISSSNESISNNIEKRVGSEVQILETTLSKNEMFVLFRRKIDNAMGMAFYQEHSLIKSRYLFGGGSFPSKDSIAEKYGIYDFSIGVTSGIDRLIVVFGDKRGIDAEKFELQLGHTDVIEDISQKDYFMAIYKIWQPKDWGGKVIFRDKDGKDITDKFYR